MAKRAAKKSRSSKPTQPKTKRRGSAVGARPKPEGPQRLNRLLAAAGYGSRRQCDDLIEEGRVEIDGEIVAKLGTTADPKKQKVLVDGVQLRQQKKVYYAVNKPTGVVTTNKDPQGRPRVIDLVPRSERVFPVGRLDRSSEGLILLTNDGDLAQQLAHPKYGVRKVYRVTVAGKVESETMRSMRRGIYLAEAHVKVEGARILKSRPKATELEIVLREGKNREIRRILARMGHKVQTLRRIAIGPLRLGEVPAGAYRPVSREEVKKLFAAAELSRQQGESELSERRESRPGKKRSSSSRSQGPAKGSKKGSPKTTARSKRPAQGSKGPKPRPSKRKQPEFEIRLPGFDGQTGSESGAVIGGDNDDQSSSTDRKGRKKRTASKTASGRGRKTKSRASASGTKRSAKKSSAKKKSPRKGKPKGKPTGKSGGKKKAASRRGANRSGKPVRKKSSKRGRR